MPIARSQRSGAIYIVVLMTGIMVSTVSLAAVTIAYRSTRSTGQDIAYRQVRLAAEAAVELIVARINEDPNWRNNHNNNQQSQPISFTDYRIIYRLVDEDGDLTDDENDLCDLFVTARLQNTAYQLKATLVPNGPALECMNYSIVSDSRLEIESLGNWSTDQNVLSNSEIDVDDRASLSANCFARGGMEGRIFGERSRIASRINLPSASVFDYYLRRGTLIPLSSIPVSSGDHIIRRELISESVNTLTNVTNPLGIYIIDCEGEDLEIEESRIHATLVLLNTGRRSGIYQSTFLEAAVENYPVLLVDGDFHLGLTRSPLLESSVRRNLNPASVPYLNESDGNQSTVYPSQVRGLVYISGRTFIEDDRVDNDLFGMLVSGREITGAGDLYVHFRSIFSEDPPPGFRRNAFMEVLPDSIMRVPLN